MMSGFELVWVVGVGIGGLEWALVDFGWCWLVWAAGGEDGGNVWAVGGGTGWRGVVGRGEEFGGGCLWAVGEGEQGIICSVGGVGGSFDCDFGWARGWKARGALWAGGGAGRGW